MPIPNSIVFVCVWWGQQKVVKLSTLSFQHPYSYNFYPSMDMFETRTRGFHAKTVQNIMARTLGFSKTDPKHKLSKPKPDNITTYLRKFDIDRENLNLAKRILLCESQHNHKYYEREWKKTKNFLRVRSNFKKGFSNQEPRIFKFQPIQGRGSCLVTLNFIKFQSNFIYFKSESVYSLTVLVKHNPVHPTNSHFTLNSLSDTLMSFYVPTSLKKKKLTCKITEIKENENYDKGKMKIDLSPEADGQQNIQIFNKQGKVIAMARVRVHKEFQDGNKQNEKTLCIIPHIDNHV